MKNSRFILIYAGLFLCIIWGSFFVYKPVLDNEGSRLAEIEAVFDHGTFDIEQSKFHSVDIVKVKSRTLSVKDPMLSMIIGVPYFIISRTFSFNFKKATAVSIKTVRLIHSLMYLGLMFWGLRMLLGSWIGSSDSFSKNMLVILVLFATLASGFSSVVNRHSLAAALTFVSILYCFKLLKNSSKKRRHYFVFGLLISTLAVIDTPSSITSILLFTYFSLSSKSCQKVRDITIASLPILALHFLLSYIKSGEFLPLVLFPEYLRFEGSYWARETLSGMDQYIRSPEPKLTYLFNLTLGHHGVFSMTPIIILGLTSSMASVFSTRLKRPRNILLLLIFFLPLPFFLFKTAGYSGGSVGFRFMIPQCMALVLATCDFITCRKSVAIRFLIILLLLISILHAVDAWVFPFHRSVWHKIIVGG